MKIIFLNSSFIKKLQKIKKVIINLIELLISKHIYLRYTKNYHFLKLIC